MVVLDGNEQSANGLAVPRPSRPIPADGPDRTSNGYLFACRRSDFDTAQPGLAHAKRSGTDSVVTTRHKGHDKEKSFSQCHSLE